MSILRQDPTTKEWVIIAGERMRRSHEYKQTARPHSAQTTVELCPFCPGHEASTLKEMFWIADAAGIGWTVRVPANQFPVLGVTGQLRVGKRAHRSVRWMVLGITK
jgi:UDPglucose--hexose-1-phosphate uridylyltransferase